MGWGSEAATVPIENRAENARRKPWVGVQAPAALPRRWETTRSGAIPAEPAGMVSIR